jgi:hypothetical protein
MKSLNFGVRLLKSVAFMTTSVGELKGVSEICIKMHLNIKISVCVYGLLDSPQVYGSIYRRNKIYIFDKFIFFLLLLKTTFLNKS